MLTKKQANKLARLIKNYADARVEDSWKGGVDPRYRPLIEKELEVSTAKLHEYITQLQIPEEK